MSSAAFQKRPYQIELENKTLNAISASSGNMRVLMMLPTGGGKCLAKGTPILMFDGSVKKVEDIQVGDLLMGEDSTKRVVKSICKGSENMYEVKPKKGDPYIVNESHILSLRITNGSDTVTCGGKRFKSGDIANVSVLDYLAANKTFKHCAKGWRAAIDFPASEKELKLDPYFLGAWLGDGTSRFAGFTTGDIEIAEYLDGFSTDNDCHLKIDYNSKNSVSIKLNDNQHRGCKGAMLMNKFKSLDLVQNKHIPIAYKTASRENRLQLLAGILDTDGHYDGKGYDLTFKSETLIDDTIFVARSLGFSAYKSKQQKTCHNNGVEGTYFRCMISGDIDQIPCKVERQKANPRRQKKNVLNVGIEVKPLGIGNYYGFEIEGDKKLFVLGDFTVTHNTEIFNSITHRCYNSPKKLRIWILAHRDELLEQAKEKLFRRYGITAGIIKAGVKPNPNYRVQIGSVQSVVGRLDKLQAPDVIIIDEAHHSSSASYKKIIEFYENARIIGVTATPYRLDGQGLNAIFKVMTSSVTVRELEEMGFLIPADCYSYPMDKDAILQELAEKSAREHKQAQLVTKGEYDQSIIGKAMSDHQVLADMVESYRKKANGRKAMCFASTVAQSKLIVDYFNSCGIESRHVDAKTENRKQIFDWLRQGKIQMVSNVGITTEGFDDPSIECIMLARKTKSLSLYLQMVGRGSRLFTRADGSKKEKYILLDFCDNFFEHCIPNADIDWQSHFEGSYVKKKKKKKKKKKDEEEKGQQFEMILEDGSIMIGSIEDIPKGMKGISLVRLADVPEELQTMEFQDLFLRLAEFSASKQHHPMAAYTKWQAAVLKSMRKGKKPSIADFNFIAEHFKYSQYWAQTQMKNLFQEVQNTHEKNIKKAA